MEDPIEFVHRHDKCIVTQREIPTDVATYSEALRSAMRESPDIVLLGEMRDYDTIGTAVTAARWHSHLLDVAHYGRREHDRPYPRCVPCEPTAPDPYAALDGLAGSGKPAARACARWYGSSCLRGHARELPDR